MIVYVFLRFQEVRSLPESLIALLYLCFNVGPVLVKAVVALTAAVGFFLVGLTIRRFGKNQQQQQQHHQANEPVRAEDYDHEDYGDGDAESGGLIAKHGPSSHLLITKHLLGDQLYLPLQHIVPTSSVTVDYDDYASEHARSR